MKIINDATKRKYDISAFITSFNNVSFVGQSIESVLQQDFTGSYHIFIHDDASTDGTQELLMKYANSFPDKITLILQSENQFNQGIPIGIDLYKYSSSDYIAYCEADDFWNSPTKLERQFNFLERNTRCSIVHSNVNILNESGNREYESHLRNHLMKYGQVNEIVSGESLCENNFIMTCSALLRRNAIPELLLSDIGSLQPLDYILFSLMTRFNSIGLINDKLATYRIHENNYWAGSSNPKIKANPEKTREFINKFSPFNFT